MPERKIEIQMATVGAAEAAAQIDNSTRAVDGLTEATQESTRETEQAATAARQDIQIHQQRAMVALQVAQGIGRMAEGVRAAAEDFKEADPDLSGTLENVAAGMESVGSMATYAAQGMAMAGPAGAAVGAAVGLAVPQIKAFYDAWVDLNLGLKEAEDSFQDVLDVEAEIAESRGIRAAIAAYREAATAADEFAQAVTRAKRAAGANAEADKAERDLADAEAIRGGADPLEVKRARVQDDARLARGGIANEGNMLASERAQREIALEKAELSNDLEKIKQAEAALAKARGAEEKYDDEAPGNRRTIDAQEKIKLRELDEKAAERERKAEEKRAADERRHADETEAMEERNRRTDEAEERARRSRAMGTAGGALGIADAAFAGGADRGFVEDLRRRAGAVQNNPSAANAAELAKMLDQLLRSLETGKGKDAANAADLKRRITALERREKNR